MCVCVCDVSCGCVRAQKKNPEVIIPNYSEVGGVQVIRKVTSVSTLWLYFILTKICVLLLLEIKEYLFTICLVLFMTVRYNLPFPSDLS